MFRAGGECVCVWEGGGGSGGIPMERMYVKMDRGGVLTHEKRQLVCVLPILKFAMAFVQANLFFLLTLQSMR